MAQANTDIRYLTPIAVDIKKKKYCRFKKLGIKYIDYKDAQYLLRFVNDQGKILPRRLTGTSLKYQKKVAQAILGCLGLKKFIKNCILRLSSP